jgi:NADP-dependent 3-hydroxy acid dehydrogenase YdfG
MVARIDIDLAGQVAWITGGGSGIGEATALALASAGAHVVLTGRRAEPLAQVASTIRKAGGLVSTAAGDLMHAATVDRIAGDVVAAHGRLDILISNAGLNITDRSWAKLTPAGIDQLIAGNLTSAFYVARAALGIMRPRKRGLLIHTASMSGRYLSPLSGQGYTAAKHGLVALSHTINIEACGDGIRSTVLCPGEVATPILDLRPVPVSAEDRARMLQPEDVARMILVIAGMPERACINEVQMAPTWNRGYLAMQAQPHVRT